MKIAILGANYSLLPYYKRTKELGYEIHSFAWEKGAVCKKYADYFYPISFKQREEILEKCKQINIDGITSFSLESAVPTVCFIANQLSLPNPINYDHSWVTNKYIARKLLKRPGCKIPDFWIIKNEKDIKIQKWPFPLIIKPVDNGGSRGVALANNLKELISYYKYALNYSTSGLVILEQYIKGREFSVESLSNKGIHYVIAVTDKVTTGAPHFVEIEHHQPAKLTNQQIDMIKKITKNALDALKIYSSPSHTELKVTPEGNIYIIEVGARMGGDMIAEPLIRLSTGYDYLQGVLEVATNNFIIPNLKFHKHAGIYFLSEETKYLKKILNNLENFSEIYSSEIYEKDIKNLKESADRSGYILYQASSRVQLD